MVTLEEYVNIKKDILKIKKQFKDGILLPTQIEFNIASSCTRKCYFCPTSKDGFYNKYNNHDFSLQLFTKVINDLSDMDYSGEIVLSGWSEPLLNKNTIVFLKLINTKLPNAKKALVTNGDLLTSDLLHKLENYLDVLLISLYDGEYQINYYTEKF